MFSSRAISLLCGLAYSQYAAALNVDRSTITDVQWSGSCSSNPVSHTTFVTTDQRVDLWFHATAVQNSDRLAVTWVQPDGGTPYGFTWNSTSGDVCFGAWLWISSDPYITARPGTWKARVTLNGVALFELPFNILLPGGNTIGSSDGPPVISSLNRSQFTPGEVYLTIFGNHFQSGAAISVDYFIGDTFQWNVAPAVATQFDSASQLRVHLSLPQAGEFRLTVKNPNQQQSGTTTILVGHGGYKLPFRQSEQWQTTQGNNETSAGFDHNVRNNLTYAYDFSDGPGHCVVAMKSGYARTHDDHLLQTTSFSPGNYISIDHGNGEYSHYFHLTTGTFTVTDGQFVQQGQALALVGNSGYAYRDYPGDGYGYHVHVEVTHDLGRTQTFPFLFDDVDSQNPSGPPPGQATRPNFYTSQNASTLGGCNVNYAPTPAPTEADIAWNAIRGRARSDSRFGNEIAGTQNFDPNWGKNDPNFPLRDLRSIDFTFSFGRTIRVFHAFYNNKTDNLGATIFYDLDTNTWAPWVNVQP